MFVFTGHILHRLQVEIFGADGKLKDIWLFRLVGHEECGHKSGGAPVGEACIANTGGCIASFKPVMLACSAAGSSRPVESSKLPHSTLPSCPPAPARDPMDHERAILSGGRPL